MKNLTIALLVPAFALCLSACEKNGVKPIPAARLTCAAEPLPPTEDTDRAVALFMVALIDAGQNCRDALAWIKNYQDALK